MAAPLIAAGIMAGSSLLGGYMQGKAQEEQMKMMAEQKEKDRKLSRQMALFKDMAGKPQQSANILNQMMGVGKQQTRRNQILGI